MDKILKHIALLGSTGSIGRQTLDVVSMYPECFRIDVLTANNNVELLIEQAKSFRPHTVVIGNKALYPRLKEALAAYDMEVLAGDAAISEVATLESVDTVLVALVGYSGLLPSISALKKGKTLALANKETLVVAGELVKELAATHKADILPVDSEHSAIFQCLKGEDIPVNKLILTASGGPFIGKDRAFLENVLPEQALCNPNWNMGAKVTIDSASLMNKGFEMIEARWLFDMPYEKIEVVVHPQSIIHSMVEFVDGSVKAQLAVPDMRLPIQYALTCPRRLKSRVENLDFKKIRTMTFLEPDTCTFRNLELARKAMKRGGNMPCILNAANEIAVKAFLEKKVSFLKMSDLIEHTMEMVDFIEKPGLEDYINTNREARKIACEYLCK